MNVMSLVVHGIYLSLDWISLASVCLLVYYPYKSLSTGFSDPYSPYGNTRAFLDYGIMGFRECTAEISRYLTNMEGVDSQDPMRTRILSHLENLLSQKELAINAAVAANSQITIPKVGGAPIQTPVSIMSMPTLSYAPLTPPRASPDNLSPPATFQAGMHDSLPRFSVAFPIPAIPLTAVGATSKGSTIAAPSIFHPNPSAGFKPVISVAQKHTAPIAIAKPAPVLNGLPRPTTRPLTVITTAPTSTVTNMTLSPISPPMDQNMTLRFEATTSTLPRSPTKMPSYSTKAPFRPWADSMTVSTQN